MKKKIIVRIICFVVILACGIGGYFLLGNKDLSFNLRGDNSSRESDGSVHVLTSIDDVVVGDSMWCGTFQLVWNDMVNEVVKKDVVFSPQLKIAENLNKQTFTNKELSPNSYYSRFGLLTLDLKDEIEKGIKEKFNETSDILDKIDWSNAPKNEDGYGNDYKEYLFYTMLKKIFNFGEKFDVLDNGKFNDKYDNIKYFGINGSSDSSLYKQVYVYYYNSDEDFAVKLKTKEGEDIILARGVNNNSFDNIYKDILGKSGKFKGNKSFGSDDYLKVPKINVDTLISFDDLKNKYFYDADGGICKIIDALQTIQFELDERGGIIKSEAAIHSNRLSASGPIRSEREYRYFYFDKPYVMFLKEEDKDLPYFAAQISDITLFQK